MRITATTAVLLIAISSSASADSLYELNSVGGHIRCTHREVIAAASQAGLVTHVINPHVNAGLTIELRATAQLEKYPAAKAAFVRAAEAWEAHITNPMVVPIDVDYGPTSLGEPQPPTRLGATQTFEIGKPYSDFAAALKASATQPWEAELYAQLPPTAVPTDVFPRTHVSTSRAALIALGLFTPTDGEQPSIARITFNSNFKFDFDRSDGVADWDFEAVAMHEIGHALGFTSTVGNGPNNTMSALDLYRLRPGATVAGFQTDLRIQSAGGAQVFFANVGEAALSTGNRAGSDGDGYQAGHWKDVFLNGYCLGIMNASVGFGVLNPSRWDLTALDLIGYAVNYPEPPNAPTNLRAHAISSSDILLTWDDNSSNETEFRLLISVDGYDNSLLELPSVVANTTSFTVTHQTSNLKYHFKVRAMNSGGWSDFSNEATATTAPPYDASPHRRAAAH
jgi:hypothetical protein